MDKLKKTATYEFDQTETSAQSNDYYLEDAAAAALMARHQMYSTLAARASPLYLHLHNLPTSCNT